MKKEGVNIHITNKSFYTITALAIFLIVGISVYAFGTSNPSTFGHSAKELDLSQGVGGDAIFNGKVTVIGTLTASNFNGSGTGELKLVKFTSSGTWTKPQGLKYVIVELVGGGAGGGAGGSGPSGDGGIGGGGGAGGYSREYIQSSSLGSTETVTIGSGGQGGTVGGYQYPRDDAQPGETTSFGSHLSATGGDKGNPSGSSSTALGGSYGLGSNGDINLGASMLAEAGYPISTGKGGHSYLGIGGNSAPGPNNHAIGSGGGGSGGHSGNTIQNTGGNGKAGAVYVWEYY